MDVLMVGDSSVTLPLRMRVPNISWSWMYYVRGGSSISVSGLPFGGGRGRGRGREWVGGLKRKDMENREETREFCF